MQKILLLIFLGVCYLYYDSTLNHHYMVNNSGKIIGQCTSSYNFLDLHSEAFNCLEKEVGLDEDVEEELDYITYNCNYKSKKYKILDFVDYGKCKRWERASKKGYEKIDTKREKIISTNFKKRRKSIFEVFFGKLDNTFEKKSRGNANVDLDYEKAAKSRVKDLQNIGKDDPDYSEDNSTENTMKSANQIRLEIYRERNGYQ